MKDVEKDMRNAIPTDFNIDTNIGDVPAAAAGGHAFNVTIPLTLNGSTLARILAEIQWTQNQVYVRNLGVG